MFKFLNLNQIYVMIGVIVVLAILVGAITYYFNPQKMERKEVILNTEGEVKIPEEWKKYENDVLGISFYYPSEWGDPYTGPSKNITDLATANKGYKDVTNDFFYAVKIYFPEEKTPVINLYNNEYKGELYPNGDALPFGYVDNILEVEKSGNICDYRVEFDHRPDYKGTIDEVYSECKNKVRTYITRNMEIYENGTLVLYNYALKDSSFVKLENGYFDNVLISYFHTAIQTPDDGVGMQDILEQVNDNYQEDKNNFVIFINSINTFKPAPPQEESFEIIEGENPHITTIRKYYFEIEKGDLGTAYNMYQDKSVSFETYEEWYKNTLIANPIEFEEIGDNRYQFKVQFQDNNQKQKLYRVIMEVNEGKIIPISSEEMAADPILFGDMTAFVKQKQLGAYQFKTYLVLSENGEEYVLDEEMAFEGGGKMFSGSLEFSPEGNYLISHIYGYEWSGINVYDIKSKKRILELNSPSMASFTPNEKYFFACAQNELGGDYYGTVYSVPDFKEIYNALTRKYSVNMNCEYDEEKQVIRFRVDNFYDSENEEAENQSKIMEFSTITGDVEIIND
ncbi:MAG: hypothetical protein PHY30_01740 [Candidatus Pacebacteria bacterium]|nr:hypothetical protein [Candidatus Paceibacterota bacterium]